ncbi:MAG: hypothetical protein M3Y42_01430 [Actinomycetota bacterium]|nr:hypothetical protein [Actinomycetota bacterium]MDQ2955610.1 hypothetical protein [Actinomycetota bacterium]
MSSFFHHPADQRPAGQDGAPAIVHAAEHVAEELDSLVPISDDVGNRVLPDNARLVRWAAPLFTVCALLMLPWIVLLGTTLPDRQLSQNYDLAWTGYDVILLIGLASTAWCTLRRSRWLPIAAAATGALLTADAWFDVLTTPGGWGLVEALAMSLLAELPLAALCFWLAVHSQDVAEQRLVLLTRRRTHG